MGTENLRRAVGAAGRGSADPRPVVTAGVPPGRTGTPDKTRIMTAD